MIWRLFSWLSLRSGRIPATGSASESSATKEAAPVDSSEAGAIPAELYKRGQEAIKNVQDTAKWLTVSFGAVAGVALGGVQLTALKDISGSARLTAALVAFLWTLMCIAQSLRSTARVMGGDMTYWEDVKDASTRTIGTLSPENPLLFQEERHATTFLKRYDTLLRDLARKPNDEDLVDELKYRQRVLAVWLVAIARAKTQERFERSVQLVARWMLGAGVGVAVFLGIVHWPPARAVRPPVQGEWHWNRAGLDAHPTLATCAAPVPVLVSALAPSGATYTATLTVLKPSGCAGELLKVTSAQGSLRVNDTVYPVAP